MATKKLARVMKAVATAALLLGPAMVSASAQSAGDIRLVQTKFAAAQEYLPRPGARLFVREGRTLRRRALTRSRVPR
jgi:hypothetical protein